MKTIFNISLGIMMLIFTATCSSTSTRNNTSKNTLEVTGVIKEQGITTYQYGTHTLISEDRTYALKSDTLDLNEYLEQEVTVTAVKIEGYPVDGGPEYLLVLEIKQ